MDPSTNDGSPVRYFSSDIHKQLLRSSSSFIAIAKLFETKGSGYDRGHKDQSICATSSLLPPLHFIFPSSFLLRMESRLYKTLRCTDSRSVGPLTRTVVARPIGSVRSFVSFFSIPPPLGPSFRSSINPSFPLLIRPPIRLSIFLYDRPFDRLSVGHTVVLRRSCFSSPILPSFLIGCLCVDGLNYPLLVSRG